MILRGGSALSPVDRLNWLACLNCKTDIKPAMLKVSAALACRLNSKTGRLDPSVNTLAKDTAMDRRSVNRAIRDLEDNKIISIDHSTGGGYAKTNSYALLPLTSESPLTHASPLTPESQTPDRRVPLPMTDESPEQGIEQGKKQGCAKSNAQSQNRFDDFWTEYPKKKDKTKARSKWISKKLDSKAEMIIADVRNRKSNDHDWTKDGGQFIPYPSTYLNGERWEDDIQQAKDKIHHLPNNQQQNRPRLKEL